MRARRRQPPQAPSAPEIVLVLPAPPSANNLFATVGRRRMRSRRYRSWLTAAGWELRIQRQGCIGGPWEAHIVLPRMLRGDADNYAKALLDLLVKHGVVADDRHCRKLTIEKGRDADAVLMALRAAP